MCAFAFYNILIVCFLQKKKHSTLQNRSGLRPEPRSRTNYPTIASCKALSFVAGYAPVFGVFYMHVNDSRRHFFFCSKSKIKQGEPIFFLSQLQEKCIRTVLVVFKKVLVRFFFFASTVCSGEPLDVQLNANHCSFRPQFLKKRIRWPPIFLMTRIVLKQRTDTEKISDFLDRIRTGSSYFPVECFPINKQRYSFPKLCQNSLFNKISKKIKNSVSR